MLEINKSSVPRIAVQKTVRTGIEMYEKIHGPATPEVKKKIMDEVIRLANLMNMDGVSAKEKEREARNPKVLYGSNKVHTTLDDE